MKTSEIQELLRLKGWKKKHLAEKLGMTPNAVYRWFIDRTPRGPAAALMQHWLTEARKGESMPTAS